MARRIAALATAVGAWALVAAAAPAATDHSFIKTGAYSATAVVPPDPNVGYPGTSFPASFRVTSATRKGIRSVRGLRFGPVDAPCYDTNVRPTAYRRMTFPRQSGFPPVGTNGFAIRSWVLRGGHWKAGRHAVLYQGTLPHVDLQLVYNRSPARFNPNPLTYPSLVFQVHLDDAGNFTPRGNWACSFKSNVTFRR
jgi:hypothetical protein